MSKYTKRVQTVSKYTKRVETIQYTETVYFEDGDEIFRVRNYDDYTYDWTEKEPMTEDEIYDYS